MTPSMWVNLTDSIAKFKSRAEGSGIRGYPLDKSGGCTQVQREYKGASTKGSRILGITEAQGKTDRVGSFFGHGRYSGIEAYRRTGLAYALSPQRLIVPA